MKVVLFCGGLGTRMRDYSDSIPKPMVNIGYRPILWHVMKYYAHYGHKDFILCLGYKADLIKNYFLSYDECTSNNFTLQKGKKVKLYSSDIHDWNITFVDTGINANIGQRLKAVEAYLDGEEAFLANYSDGLTDLHLPTYIDYCSSQDKIANFVCAHPSQSFHIVQTDSNNLVQKVEDTKQCDIWVNAGYFLFKKEIFQYIRDGEELVYEPFQRLIEQQQLLAYKFTGFWGCMDTFKEKQQLDEMFSRGNTPWQVWKTSQVEQRIAV